MTRLSQYLLVHCHSLIHEVIAQAPLRLRMHSFSTIAIRLQGRVADASAQSA